jgi:hypothetical protein
MLTGKRFKLKTPTVAVDGNRVAVTIPAAHIVEVISGPSDSDQTINVLWNGQAVVMFGIDLRQRGEDIGDSGMHARPSLATDREQALAALNHDLRVAQQRRDEASALFSDIMKDVPSGIPHPDGTDRIHQASQKYSNAQKEAMDALMRLNKFLIHGTLPEDLERKPAQEESPKRSAKKSGEA